MTDTYHRHHENVPAFSTGTETERMSRFTYRSSNPIAGSNVIMPLKRPYHGAEAERSHRMNQIRWRGGPTTESAERPHHGTDMVTNDKMRLEAQIRELLLLDSSAASASYSSCVAERLLQQAGAEVNGQRSRTQADTKPHEHLLSTALTTVDGYRGALQSHSVDAVRTEDAMQETLRQAFRQTYAQRNQMLPTPSAHANLLRPAASNTAAAESLLQPQRAMLNADYHFHPSTLLDEESAASVAQVDAELDGLHATLRRSKLSRMGHATALRDAQQPDIVHSCLLSNAPNPPMQYEWRRQAQNYGALTAKWRGENDAPRLMDDRYASAASIHDLPISMSMPMHRAAADHFDPRDEQTDANTNDDANADTSATRIQSEHVRMAEHRWQQASPIENRSQSAWDEQRWHRSHQPSMYEVPLLHPQFRYDAAIDARERGASDFLPPCAGHAVAPP